MEMKILVAAHKPYPMPQQAVYCPIWVGAANRGPAPDGWLRDDDGEHISQKNDTFCELTALYWAWKNLDAEYLGLCHYRRYFAQSKTGEKFARIAAETTLRQKLGEAPVLLPQKRNYYIETNYTQYVHAHHAQDLDETRRILEEKFPDYLPAYDASMQRTDGHRFNMMVMRRDLLNSYCEWLFAVLFELENRLDISDYSTNDRRVFGFVSERLLDVWLETNGVNYTELPVVNLESQHWPKKILNFLKRKFIGKAAQA